MGSNVSVNNISNFISTPGRSTTRSPPTWVKFTNKKVPSYWKVVMWYLRNDRLQWLAVLPLAAHVRAVAVWRLCGRGGPASELWPLAHTLKVSSNWHRSPPCSAWKSSIRKFVITEKAPTRAFSWLKAATTAFTFKTLLRHYAKRALTPQSLNVKLGPRRNYHKEQAAIRHYANQTARPLWPLCRGPNFTLRDRGVNTRLA